MGALDGLGVAERACELDVGAVEVCLGAHELMRGVGNLCIGADSDPRYDARRLVELLIAGLRRPHEGAR